MKPKKRKIALFGIIIPALIFIIYGIICWKTDPFGIVLTDMLVKIPIMFIALKILHRAKPVERKSMPGKRMAAMLAVFAVAVCVPTQLMAHMAASAGRAEGLALCSNFGDSKPQAQPDDGGEYADAGYTARDLQDSSNLPF